MPRVRVRCSFALIVMHGVLRKDAVVAARELYSGSAILRGLPAWALFLEGGCAPFKKCDCGDLGGQPPSGRRQGMASARAVLGWAVEPCLQDDLKTYIHKKYVKCKFSKFHMCVAL